MPFKSEKQRRYLWANEPEIARDWTETYGSKIQKANGGITRLNYRYGGDTRGGPNDRSANRGPAGGASAGGNYGGDMSYSIGPVTSVANAYRTASTSHSHSVSGITVSAPTGAVTADNKNLPPYFALAFIMKT